MPTIVVGYVAKPEGRAALRAVAEPVEHQAVPRRGRRRAPGTSVDRWGGRRRWLVGVTLSEYPAGQGARQRHSRRLWRTSP